MECICRLCGPRSGDEELVTKLTDEIEGIKLRKLVEMFCHVVLDEDPELPQDVCDVCQKTLFQNVAFSRRIEEYQEKLSQQLKSEVSRPVVIQSDLYGHFFSSGSSPIEIHDEDLDSPLSVEESSNSNNDIPHATRTSRVIDYSLKECTVALEILPLIYEESDPENEPDDESENYERSPKRAKLDVAESRLSASPQKRMQPNFNSSFTETVKVPAPFAPTENTISKQERNKPNSCIVIQTISSRYIDEKYQQIFEIELTENILECPRNLNVNAAAKEDDGSVNNAYVDLFASWNSIGMKCPGKQCKAEQSPYDFMLHRKTVHGDEGNEVFKCALCVQSVETFNLVNFCQHIIGCHHQYLKYCCVVCSKLFYNFAALGRHYCEHHSDIGIFVCFRDGSIFDSIEALENHVKKHTGPPTNRCRKRLQTGTNQDTSIKERSQEENYSNDTTVDCC